jgi:organic hydroperoxide reductase OsmC/OhrA
MAHRTHIYRPVVEWTGNVGSGTSDYRAYERAHVIRSPGKADILGSSDPAFCGDAARWNPEDLFVAAVSACHQLWYCTCAPTPASSCWRIATNPWAR